MTQNAMQRFFLFFFLIGLIKIKRNWHP